MAHSIKKILSKLFFFFTPYVNSYEWKVNRFCKWVTSYRSKKDVEKRLLSLMQENLIITTIWLEKKYKGYRYLTKGVRKKLYRNAQLIQADFETFASELHQAKSHAPHDARKAHITAIMAYFKPERGKYTYKEGVSFGKLLTDPEKEHYVGDCNQIVTLYAAFYARLFPIDELNIKLIPGHVCLHYNGEDIEATNATWKKYDTYDYIAPITELIATNLLDICEEGEKLNTIDPEVFVKGAQLAALVSQKRSLVEHNMRIAYHNLCVRALNSKDLQKAYFYALKLNDMQLLRSCYAHEYNDIAERVRTVQTVRDARKKKALYKRMLELAHKLGNIQNIRSIEKILDQIKKLK